MRIVLASGSPRRQELLRQIGLTFETVPSGVTEASIPGEVPAEMACRLALAKAADIAGRHPDALVIGADTIVVLDGRVLGKPKGNGQACDMLASLAGRRHLVITGVALVQRNAGLTASGFEETSVWFQPLTDQQIARYVATGEPMDKAGAYGVQGRAAAFVERLEGDYFNVVGLPLNRLVRMLAECGVELL